MEAVLGLVEGGALGTVHDFVGDLVVAVGGEAVEDDGVGLGQLHQLLVDLEILEVSAAADGLLVHAGADPDVCVDDVGAGDGGLRVVADGDRPAVLGGQLLGLGDDVGARLVGGRGCDFEFDAEEAADEQEGVADVVAIADPGEVDCAKVAFLLADGEEVGEGLAGVLETGHGVDDGHAGGGGEL